MREAILALLRTLPAQYAFEDRGSSVWLRCPNPQHTGQTGKSPPFKISLDPPFSGSHFCFGCGAHGPWPETVRLFGFKSSARFLAEEQASASFSEAEEASLLGRKKPKTGREVFREKWPRSQSWRNVPGKLIADIGGSMIIGGDGREPVLRLPVMVRNVERGFIDCKIRPAKDEQKKYINAPGTWAHDVLFPYDYVRSLDPDIAALVEGPRDALVTIRNGLPALATLGSTSWNRKCVNLVLSLGLKTLLLMLDPDTAGEKLMHLVYKDLSPHMQVIPVRLSSKMVKDSSGKLVRKKLCDPADLNRRKLDRVCELAGVRLEAAQ